MHRVRVSYLALAIITAAAGGCASQIATVTSYDVLFRPGVPSEFAYAATPVGAMPVIVIGNPFPLPQLAVNQRVIAAMQGSTPGAPVRFVSVAAEQAPAGYAVLVVLNAPGGTSADLVCAQRGALQPPPRSPDETTMLAAFCGAGDARSWAWSRTGATASPDDPRFGQLVARTTFAMLPPRDDSRSPGNYW